jgi:hypothetical protein
MDQVVTIRCPQGIQRLIDLGRAVARDQTWATHPRATEAFVGFWLDVQLARADMRGSLQVSEAQVQGSALGQVASPDQRLIDETLEQWLTLSGELVRDKAEPPNAATIDVALPPDTGALPLVVVVAAVAASATIQVFAIIHANITVRHLIDVGSTYIQRLEGAQRLMKINEQMKTEGRTQMNEMERAFAAMEHARAVEATKAVYAKEPGTSLFGDISTETLIGAGLALGLLLVLTRSPK